MRNDISLINVDVRTCAITHCEVIVKKWINDEPQRVLLSFRRRVTGSGS